jgi:hypothetical protein
MFAKKEWFNRRKYGGWGVSIKTWQGFVYLGLVFIPFLIFHILPFWSNKTRIIVSAFWVLFLFIDIVPIMIKLKKDELEYKIEAISERNAAWFMALVLIIGLLYELIITGLQNQISVNWFIVMALFGGVIVKTISNIILEKRGV